MPSKVAFAKISSHIEIKKNCFSPPTSGKEWVTHSQIIQPNSWHISVVRSQIFIWLWLINAPFKSGIQLHCCTDKSTESLFYDHKIIWKTTKTLPAVHRALPAWLPEGGIMSPKRSSYLFQKHGGMESPPSAWPGTQTGGHVSHFSSFQIIF